MCVCVDFCKCVCVDLVWVANNAWETASVCGGRGDLVWVADNIWKSASERVYSSPHLHSHPPTGEFYVLPYRKSESNVTVATGGLR